MIITLKNFEILNATSAIRGLIKISEMETKTKWNFIKNLNNLQRIVDDFSKAEIDFVKDYALKNENGDVIVYEADEGLYKKGDPKFDPAKESMFIKKRNELLQCNSELDINKIKLDDLPNIDDGTLLLLCSFLVDDNE